MDETKKDLQLALFDCFGFIASRRIGAMQVGASDRGETAGLAGIPRDHRMR